MKEPQNEPDQKIEWIGPSPKEAKQFGLLYSNQGNYWTAVAIGPLPDPGQVGPRGEYASVTGATKEEAKRKLVKLVQQKMSQEKK